MTGITNLYHAGNLQTGHVLPTTLAVCAIGFHCSHFLCSVLSLNSTRDTYKGLWQQSQLNWWLIVRLDKNVQPFGLTPCNNRDGANANLFDLLISFDTLCVCVCGPVFTWAGIWSTLVGWGPSSWAVLGCGWCTMSCRDFTSRTEFKTVWLSSPVQALDWGQVNKEIIHDKHKTTAASFWAEF